MEEFHQTPDQARQNAPANPYSAAPETPPEAPPPIPGSAYGASPSMAAGTRFSIGAVISQTFSTLMKNPVLYLVLSVIVAIPNAMAEAVSEDSGMSFVLAACSFVIAILMQGAMAYGVYRSLIGEKASVGEALSNGLSRIVPLVLTSLLVSIALGVAFLLLIIPGLILSCILAVAIPACVVERQGVMASINRSADLTKGYRWSIFGLYVLIFIALFAFAFAVVIVGGQMENSIVSLLFNIAFTAVYNVLIATLYYALRSDKEGVGVDKLARVFD